MWFSMILRGEEMICVVRFPTLLFPHLLSSELIFLDHFWIQFGCCSCGALDRKHLLEIVKGTSKHRTSHAVFGVLGFKKGKLRS